MGREIGDSLSSLLRESLLTILNTLEVKNGVRIKKSYTKQLLISSFPRGSAAVPCLTHDGIYHFDATSMSAYLNTSSTWCIGVSFTASRM
jgi:hypothetical protein